MERITMFDRPYPVDNQAEGKFYNACQNEKGG